jgi:hypothetical protein
MDLSLRFKDNGTGHRDVELRVGGRTWVCDSYYFALDRNLLPEREDAPKIRAVLRRLLEQWLSAVRDLPDAGVVCLPYDFSDQYTAWLSCKRSGVQIDLCRGWAPVEGWSISPSDVGAHLSSLGGFITDGPTIQMTIDELADAIRRSMLDL